MLDKTIARSLLRPPSQPLSTCTLRQWRTFSTTYARLADPKSKAPSRTSKVVENTTASKQAGAKATSPPLANTPDPLAGAPRSYGKRVDEFVPKVLNRPIGMNQPPRSGDNTGKDTRTIRQRRDDLVNWEKHLERREQLKSLYVRPYFRDWTNMRHHEGKTFICPPRAFKHEHSLYFPNMFGHTLLKSTSLPRSTTPLLRGKASVVAVFSSGWAERQTLSFTSETANPRLHKLLQEYGGRAQLVRVNIEDQSLLKYWILRILAPFIRRNIKKENWDKYFMVRAGITDEIRESIGYLNSKVGYVYLVDGDCRLRWAGSGDAQTDEVKCLNKGLVTLLDEMNMGVWDEKKTGVRATPLETRWEN